MKFFTNYAVFEKFQGVLVEYKILEYLGGETAAAMFKNGVSAAVEDDGQHVYIFADDDEEGMKAIFADYLKTPESEQADFNFYKNGAKL